MTKHHAVKHARQCNRYAIQFRCSGNDWYATYYTHLALCWLATARGLEA